MKQLKVLGLGTVLLAGAGSANAYDVVKRYKLIDDKLKTERMLSPIGHDFFFDLGVAANKNVSDVIDDIKEAADKSDVNEAKVVLTKHDKTEQSLKINLGLGFPLPSFTAWDVNVKPNFRVLVDVGANIGIRDQKLNNEDLINLFKDELPAEIKQLILGLDLNTYAGQDIKTICNGDGAVQANPIAKAYCDNLPAGKYVIPTNAGTEPTMSLYAKADMKAGFFNNWTSGKHFFGNFNLYGMGRADLYQFITSTQIAAGDKIEKPDELNTEVTLQSDFRFGYKNTNYSIFAAVEELKIAQMKDRKEKSKEHAYGYDALIRLHGEALFRTANFSIKPFAGAHKREGYDFADGAYLGTDLGTHVWGDRLGILMRGMVDKQYLTLSPQVKLWLMQFQYSLKKPLKDMDDDVKLSVIHSVDFRIFF